MTTSGEKGTAEKLFAPRAVAYLRKNGEIYIEAISLQIGVAGIAWEPFIAHNIKDGFSDLGSSVLEAQAGSLSYVEREKHLEFVPPYFEWAGVTSHSQFSRNTKSVSMRFEREHIKFLPTTNKRGGWYGIKAKVALIDPDSTPEQIGEQLLKSFEDAVV